jgi:hypothetical protein
VGAGRRAPEQLLIAPADLKGPRWVTNVAPVFDLYEMGSARLVEWLSVDGQLLRGALMLPAGYAEGPSTHWLCGSTGRLRFERRNRFVLGK